MSGALNVDGGVLEFEGFDSAVASPSVEDNIKLWFDTNDNQLKTKNFAGDTVPFGAQGAMAVKEDYFEAGSSVAMFDIDPIANESQYTNIILEMWLRGDGATFVSGLIRPNNDATLAKYVGGMGYSYTSSTTWAGGTIASLMPISGWLDGTSSRSGSFSYLRTLITRYNSTTRYKQCYTHAMGNFGGSSHWVGHSIITWEDLSVINRITIAPHTGNWIAGSGYRLWLQ